MALPSKVPWDAFVPILDQAYEVERKSPAGIKRINPLILFKNSNPSVSLQPQLHLV